MKLANFTYPALENDSTGTTPGVAEAFFFSLDRCSADTGPFFFVPHSEQPIRANKAEGRIGFCGSIRSQLMAFGWGLRPRTPVNGLCSRCGLGNFTYRRRAAVKSCPVIRWQGERMKRQGLRRALTGGRSVDRGRMLRRHPSRQQKDAVTLAGRGCAPWPVLWWELLLSVWLVPCGQRNIPPPIQARGGEC